MAHFEAFPSSWNNKNIVNPTNEYREQKKSGKDKWKLVKNVLNKYRVDDDEEYGENGVDTY